MRRVRLISRPGIRDKPKLSKKREFSKLHVVFADALVAFVFIANAILSIFDKQLISDLAVAIVTIYGGFATGGYFTVCAIRDTSLNKHGLRIQDGVKEQIPPIDCENNTEVNI